MFQQFLLTWSYGMFEVAYMDKAMRSMYSHLHKQHYLNQPINAPQHCRPLGRNRCSLCQARHKSSSKCRWPRMETCGAVVAATSGRPSIERATIIMTYHRSMLENKTGDPGSCRGRDARLIPSSVKDYRCWHNETIGGRMCECLGTQTER